MNTSVVSFVLVGLLAVSVACAEEPTTWLADVDLTGLLTDVHGNEAKFNQYRDLHDGVYARGHFLYDTDTWFLKGDTKDIGYETQAYRLEGGMWGVFRADGYYQELPHNITFGGRSMFTGVGSGQLLLPSSVDPKDFTTWPSVFDYSTILRQAGGDLSIPALKPFFLTVSGQVQQQHGTKPAGVSLEASDLFALELPEPVQYQTDTVKADLGYAGKQLSLDLYGIYSRFHNSNDELGFPNIFDQTTGAIIPPGAATTPDALTLPPSNTYYKVGFKGSVALPFHSKLDVNTGWSQTTSSATLRSTDVLDAIAPAPSLPLTLSQREFNGKVATQNVDVAVTTSPISLLDGQVFYKYYNRSNQSDRITQTDPAGDVFLNNLFSYHKNAVGGDLGFWLPWQLHLTIAYAHVITDRRNQDADQHNATTADTTDDIPSVVLNWKGLDFVTARIGYEYLGRSSSFRPGPGPDGAPVPGARNFDIAPQSANKLKVDVDLDPTDALSFGVGYRHTEIDYNDLTFGLKDARREEVVTNVDVRIGPYVQLFGSFDYQWITRSQAQQDQSISPAALWSLNETETYYDLSVGTNVILLPRKLVLRVQYHLTKSDGNVDLTLSPDALNNPASALAGTGANNSNIDIPNLDNYTKQSVGAELMYSVTNQLSVGIGYAYEHFSYSDTRLNGYQFVPFTTGADHSGAFLTGALASQSYNANMVFAKLTYKFQ